MEYIDLIREIKDKTPEDFMRWYRNKIQYTTETIDPDETIDPNARRYDNLFNHLLDQYDEGEISEYHGLLKLIIPDTGYFVECCKKELIEKISKYHKLYEISFYDGDEDEDEDEDNQYILIAQEKKRYGRFVEFEVLELVEISKDGRLETFLEPSKIIKFNHNNNDYYDMEVQDGGMLNYSLMDNKYFVSLYE